MSKLKVLDLFSGIGGFSLGLERTGGFETVAFCEIEEFPRKVLAKHCPKDGPEWAHSSLYSMVFDLNKKLSEYGWQVKGQGKGMGNIPSYQLINISTEGAGL